MHPEQYGHPVASHQTSVRRNLNLLQELKRQVPKENFKQLKFKMTQKGKTAKFQDQIHIQWIGLTSFGMLGYGSPAGLKP